MKDITVNLTKAEIEQIISHIEHNMGQGGWYYGRLSYFENRQSSILKKLKKGAENRRD